MTLEIKVGPPQLTIHQGYTVMVSDPDGRLWRKGRKASFFLDTRLISSWAMFANGVRWKMLNGGALAASAARVYFTNPPILTFAGNIPENTLGLILGRHIDGGMHEDIDITNYGPQKVCSISKSRSAAISPTSSRSRAGRSRGAARSGAIGPPPRRN